ncbi:MAG: hypothetical protein JRI88_02050 [Deltaproteobacteria bacterium]|nr:hypothetical protein [Deltaproteobacteria bacterium]
MFCSKKSLSTRKKKITIKVFFEEHSLIHGIEKGKESSPVKKEGAF